MPNPSGEVTGTRSWAHSFLVVTLVAALFGLGHLAVTAVGIAETLFAGLLAALLVTLILGLLGGLEMTIGNRRNRSRVGPDPAGR